MNDQTRLDELAEIFALPREVLERHLILPLAPPLRGKLPGWRVPDLCQRILSITDGFWLFEQEWGFRWWGSQEYQQDAEWHNLMNSEQLFPIFGDFPHMVSFSAADGTIRSSDLEVQDRPEHGWRHLIASNVQVYLSTVIEVREAYARATEGEESEDLVPSDWWDPYASNGSRYDLEQ